MPYSSLDFTTQLWGSPNLAAASGYKGIRRYEQRFAEDGSDNMLLPEYEAEVDALGMYYLDSVRRQFAKSHGRSGETAASMESSFTPFTFDTGVAAMEYKVSIAGNVGFVLNPLPFHLIPGSAFLNPQDQHEGRTENFYSPFDYLTKAGAVPWYQGGGESYSPDHTWYQSQLPQLAEMGQATLSRVAAHVAVLWNQAGSGLVPLSPAY